MHVIKLAGRESNFEGSELATHIHEGDLGSIIDHFMFCFSGQEELRC